MGRPCGADQIAAGCKADQSMAPGDLVPHTAVEILARDFLAARNFITERLDQSENGIFDPGIACIVTVTNQRSSYPGRS
jgi:hypothetical protein